MVYSQNHKSNTRPRRSRQESDRPTSQAEGPKIYSCSTRTCNPLTCTGQICPLRGQPISGQYSIQRRATRRNSPQNRTLRNRPRSVPQNARSIHTLRRTQHYKNTRLGRSVQQRSSSLLFSRGHRTSPIHVYGLARPNQQNKKH